MLRSSTKRFDLSSQIRTIADEDVYLIYKYIESSETTELLLRNPIEMLLIYADHMYTIDACVTHMEAIRSRWQACRSLSSDATSARSVPSRVSRPSLRLHHDRRSHASHSPQFSAGTYQECCCYECDYRPARPPPRTCADWVG